MCGRLRPGVCLARSRNRRRRAVPGYVRSPPACRSSVSFCSTPFRSLRRWLFPAVGPCFARIARARARVRARIGAGAVCAPDCACAREAPKSGRTPPVHFSGVFSRRYGLKRLPDAASFIPFHLGMAVSEVKLNSDFFHILGTNDIQAAAHPSAYDIASARAMFPLPPVLGPGRPRARRTGTLPSIDSRNICRPDYREKDTARAVGGCGGNVGDHGKPDLAFVAGAAAHPGLVALSADAVLRRCSSGHGRRGALGASLCGGRLGLVGARAARLFPLRLRRAFGGVLPVFHASELRCASLGRRDMPPTWGHGVHRSGGGPVGDASPSSHACGRCGRPASCEGALRAGAAGRQLRGRTGRGGRPPGVTPGPVRGLALPALPALALGGPLMLLAIDWRLALFLWAVPVAMTFWTGGLVTMVCHRWSSRPHAAGDDSRNNPLATLLSWGEDWHNSHHADPGKSVFHPWLDVGGAMTGCLDMLQSSSGRNSLSTSSRKYAFGTCHSMELPRGRPDRTRKSAQVGREIALLNYSLWYAHVWIRYLGLSLCGRETCYHEGATALSRWTAGTVTGKCSQDVPAQRSPHITLKLDRCKHFKTAGQTRKLKRPSRTVVSRVSHYAGIVMSTSSDIRNGQ